MPPYDEPYYDPAIWRALPPVAALDDGHIFTPHIVREYIYRGRSHWGYPVVCRITLTGCHLAPDWYACHACAQDDVYYVPDYVRLSQLEEVIQ